jgi:gluconokinase
MADEEGVVILACSALKRAYREKIGEAAGEPVLFVHLKGNEDLVTARQAARIGHYMPPSLVHSQYEALEMPSAEERSVTVGIDAPPAQILSELLSLLKVRDIDS